MNTVHVSDVHHMLASDHSVGGEKNVLAREIVLKTVEMVISLPTYLSQKRGCSGVLLPTYLPTSRYLARVSSCLLAFCAFWRVFASVLCL